MWRKPAPMAAAWPMTVIRLRWPRAFTRRTQKPLVCVMGLALCFLKRQLLTDRSEVSGSNGAIWRHYAALAGSHGRSRPDRCRLLDYRFEWCLPDMGQSAPTS